MAHLLADRVLETSTTTGTGAFTLAGAVTGFRTFASQFAVADTTWYLIEGVDANGIPTGEWETGLGTYSAANTLTRTTVYASSNANAAVNFSAGTKRVAMTLPSKAGQTFLHRVPANLAATVAATAANLEANTNSQTAFSILVPAGTMISVDALLQFTTNAATTGVAIGANVTTNAAGTANVVLNAAVLAPVTNAAAATSVERVTGVTSTTLNATVGVAILNTASVSPQGGQVNATLVNNGTAAVTFRIVFGTEVANAAGVVLQANSVIRYTMQAV